MKQTEKLAKFIAHCGLCSRRQAEELIFDQKVKVNHEIVTTPATRVSNDDVIEINNKILKKIEKLRIWLFYKPKFVITSRTDPDGRDTIYNVLPKLDQRVISVGRLDYNSEGLLILTNKGDFSRFMELPSSAFERIYHVRIFGVLNDYVVSELKNGVVIDGIEYRSITVKNIKDCSSNSNRWVEVTLLEGKNREIRRVFDHFDIKVSRLIRIAYGSFNLGDLEDGELIELSEQEVNKQIESLGF